MPDIAKVLKDEIQRLSRREIKAATTSLRKDNAALKHSVADLKRRLSQLESINKKLVAKAEASQPKASAKVDADEVKSARITAKMIRSIRDRLGLSQDNFAKLVGVSGQAVYQWERKAGRLDFRGDAKRVIVAVRKMTKDEAKLRLAELKTSR